MQRTAIPVEARGNTTVALRTATGRALRERACQRTRSSAHAATRHMGSHRLLGDIPFLPADRHPNVDPRDPTSAERWRPQSPAARPSAIRTVPRSHSPMTALRLGGGCGQIYDLVAACPAWVPHSVVGYANRGAWHLTRILAALPADGEFPSHAARWFYLLTLLSVKMEYLLVRLFAREEGEHMWARNLGPRLKRARALLPPDDFAHSWRGTRRSCYSALARAVDTLFCGHRPPAIARGRGGVSLCPGEGRPGGGLTRRAHGRAAAPAGESHPPTSPPSCSGSIRGRWRRRYARGLGGCLCVAEGGASTPSTDRRLAERELLSAARTFRASSAPGPDGISGGLLKFWACHFPELTSEILWRQFLLLRDSVDPLVAATIMDATVGGIPKPNGKIRPIVVAQTMTRCILARLVRRSRREIRELLERKGQYCQSGVFPCIARLLEGIAWCARMATPWCLTSVDEENAFNSASQAALAEAARELARVAPELAACALRSQCAVRAGGDELDGAQEMVLRGAYPPRDSARAHDRSVCAGWCPGLARHAGPIWHGHGARRRGGYPACARHDHLVVGCRCWTALSGRPSARGRPHLQSNPPTAWASALSGVLASSTSGLWVGPGGGPVDGEVSAAYADDAHSSGWVPKALYKALLRVVVAREKASLEVNMGKCRVLAPGALAAHITALMAPLRQPGSEAWAVVPHLRVLGVMLADPAAGADGLGPVRDRLAVRVGDPLRRLVADIEAGADRSAAFFLARRFVLPNLMFHMQAWGLHAPPDLWSDVDAALDAFTAALAPADLRHLVSPGSTPPEGDRASAGDGGPRASPSRPRRRPFEPPNSGQPADAEATGALHVRAGYRPAPRAPVACRPLSHPARHPAPTPRGSWSTLATLAAGDADGGGRWAAHLHSRRLRGSLWCLDAPPWDDRVALSDTDWDMQWRLNFGGISEALRLRIDRPAERHGWRGKVMEYVVADAISACVPAGVLRTHMQPHTERSLSTTRSAVAPRRLDPSGRPPRGHRGGIPRYPSPRHRRGHHQRGLRSALSRAAPDSALSNIVLKHMESIESVKDRRYKAYYRDFHPLVVSLGGGVTERGWGVIKRICRTAAGLSRPRLEWEPYDWAVRALRHIAAGMARVVGWIATRVPEDAPDDCVVRVADREQGRALALFPPSAGGSQDAHGLGARLADPVGEVLLLPATMVDGGCGAAVGRKGGALRP